MKFVTFLIVTLLLMNHAQAADASMSHLISAERVQSTLEEIENSSAFDQLSKEAQLAYLRLLQLDMNLARDINEDIEMNVSGDFIKTGIKTTGIVLVLGAEAYWGWKLLASMVQTVPKSLQSASQAWKNEAYYKVDGLRVRGPVDQAGLKIESVEFSYVRSKFNVLRIPRAMSEAGTAFLSGVGVRLIGAGLFAGAIYFTYQGRMAVLMSEESFTQAQIALDQKINTLSAEIAAMAK